ncbi:MAG: hypothetical protein D3926_09575 [Desulfobacteraceae bacterium]|nr:MAG: hypothetical protein D3926_09575 [Desulfobacteraceae bacterium]
MRLVLVLFIGFISCVNVAFASFPSANYPNGVRPRLWLTQERVTALNTAMNTDTAEWMRFKALCDDLLTTDPEDLWQGVQSAIAPLALMYVLTQNDAYAARAFYFMDEVSDNYEDSGDAGHIDHGYLALGYDWLYDHALMTPAKKAQLIAKMEKLSEEMWSDYNGSGIDGNGQDTDAIIVSGAHHLMFGCALFGDSNEAVDMLDRSWWLWENGQGAPKSSGQLQYTLRQPIREWVRKAMGGHWHTGFMYFMGTDSNGLGAYYMSFRSACGYDPGVQEPELKEFWPNVVRTILDLTDPARTGFHYTGDWQDPWGFSDLSYVYKLINMASYESGIIGESLWNSYGRGFSGRIDEGYHNDEFKEFFYSDPLVTPKNPYSAGLPEVRFCDGNDFLFFRDGWDTTARWGLFSGQGTIPADHQAPDVGNFFLFREDDYLTKGRRIYGGVDIGPAYNNMAIQNSLPNGSPIMTGSEGPASMERYRGKSSMEGTNDATIFAYAMMQGDDQWNDDTNQWEPINRVSSYRRHFFWSGDNAIVFDRLRTNDVGWSTYRLHAQTEPTLSGATITQNSANGRHALLHQTLEPSGCTFVKVNETQTWQDVFEDYEINKEERLWHYAISPPDGNRVNMLSVMQMGNAGKSSIDGLEHLTSSGQTGAKLGDWCVLFSSEEQLRSMSQYTIAAPANRLHHLVCDLEPGVYSLSINGKIQVNRIHVADRDNTAYFITNHTSGPMVVTLESCKLIPPVTNLLLGD